jgi:rhodanese-related sulfurtransferase
MNMAKTVKPLISLSALSLFFSFIGLASLTLGYMHAARKPAPPLRVINSDELQENMKTGNVIVINVLSGRTFKDNHVTGSINIPLKNLRSSAKRLFDRNQSIVVYCASAHCNASHKAAQILGRAGFKKVFVYEGGMKDWFSKKLPTTGPCTMRYLYNGDGQASRVGRVCKVKTTKKTSHKKKRRTTMKKHKKKGKKEEHPSSVKAKKTRKLSKKHLKKKTTVVESPKIKTKQ